MIWNYTLISGVLHFTAFISIIIAYITWRRRLMPSATALCLLMCAIAEWAFTSGLEAAAVGVGLKIILTKFEYLGILSAPVLFLVFVSNYIQRTHWITVRNVILLSIVPLIGYLLTITNEHHKLIWSGFIFNQDFPNMMIFEHGPIYYILLIYSYLIITTGVILLVRELLHTTGENRSRISILLTGSLFPIAAGILYGTGINPMPGLDLVPVSFSITGIIVAIGIFRMGIFTIIPIARESLIENMRDGVLVLDAQNHVVDINLAAQKTIGISAREILGKPASHLPENWMTVASNIEDTLVSRKEIRLSTDPPRYLDLQTTLLYDRRRNPRGRLIVFRDVTERRKAELELALQAEELSLLNQINLSITSGLDLDHVLKTLHEQCSAIIPCDVFYVALYEETTGIIQIPIYFEKEYQFPPPRDLHKNPGLTGHVIETRQTLYVPDVLTPKLPPGITPVSVGGTPTRAYIAIPLLLRDKVIGVMSVQSYTVDAFNDKQIRLLETVAVEAAIAIENARLYGEVQRLAIVDELTGVYNYRGLIELGRREVERARRFNHPLSVLFFDIDKFRDFNNTYSHATGNLVLKAIADQSKVVLRSVDIFTRYGGDEFVIILPETSTAMARKVAHRLLKKIASTLVLTKYGELSVTISIGLTMLTEKITDISTLIDNANRAEHRAKKAGNCIEIEE